MRVGNSDLVRSVFDQQVRVNGHPASVGVDCGVSAGAKLSRGRLDHSLLTRRDAGAWLVLELADTRRDTRCEPWAGHDGRLR